MPCIGQSHVDWQLPGPLANSCCCLWWNWPFCPEAVGVNYSIVDKPPVKNIYYPIKEPFPGFIMAMPCFWIHACFFLCVDSVKALVIMQDRQNATLTCELRVKTACAERVEARRDKVVLGACETKAATLFQSKQAR